MYRIIGADGRQYGPVPGQVVRRWVAEGRVTGQTPAQAEGTAEWKPLSAFPEFADLAVPASISGAAPPPVCAPPQAAPRPRTSSMATAGFICGLLGLMCCMPVLSVPGLAFSIIGLVETRRQPDKFAGEGLAITGLVLGMVGVALVVLMIIACLSGVEIGRIHRIPRWHL